MTNKISLIGWILVLSALIILIFAWVINLWPITELEKSTGELASKIYWIHSTMTGLPPNVVEVISQTLILVESYLLLLSITPVTMLGLEADWWIFISIGLIFGGIVIAFIGIRRD